MAKKIKYEMTLIMGKAGTGKSTLMALLINKSLNQGRKVYCSHHVLGTNYLDPKWLGRYDLCDSDIYIDEAQLIYDNRNFKSLTDETKYFISNFRHLKCRIWIFSQSFEDLDVKIRRQAHKMYLIQPSIIPYFIQMEKIRMKFGINEEGTDIITRFKSGLFDLRFKFAVTGWKYFDSYSRPDFPMIPIERLWGKAPNSNKDIVLDKLKEQWDNSFRPIKEYLWSNKKFRRIYVKRLRNIRNNKRLKESM